MEYSLEPSVSEDAGGDGRSEVRGRRRTWTVRNSAARQMPSRQCQGSDTVDNPEDAELLARSTRGEGGVLVERRAQVIAAEMEQDTQLMQDNPEAEELRKEALRELPQCLTMKRTVRAKISASVSLRSKRKPISWTRRLKYRVSFGFKRLRERSKDLFFSVELWYEAIRSVEGHFGSAVGSYFYFLRSLFVINALLSLFVCCFVVLPQILHDNHVGGSVGGQTSNNVFLDFLSGQGMFEDTVLFYGHYQTDTVTDSSYNMTYAYFFTMVVLYLFFFGVLSVRTAWSYRRNFIETAGGLGQVYAAKVFCGWDFGIATRSAAANNSRNIYNELKELLSEQNKMAQQRSRCDRLSQLCLDVSMNLLVLAVLAAVLTLFWWLLSERAGTQETVYWPLALAFIVTATLTLGPIFFSYVVRLESYSARTALYVTLARSFVLDVSTLLLLLVFWLRRQHHCWETMLGQEVYRLIVLDVVFSVVLVPLVEYIRSLVYSKVFPSHTIEFDVSYNSLCLVYNQALLWLGLIFSPPLAVIVCCKMFLTFYVRRAVVMRACQPARKLWRAAQTETALHLLVYLSLLGSLCVLGFVVIRSTSQRCGPFQQYRYVYEVLTEGVLNLSQRPTLNSVLVFITRPGVIGLLLVLLCAGVYYLRARAIAHKSMVSLLRDMLVLEAKDKDFLLSAIAKVSNGEWLYSPKHETLANDSHTWRYLNDDKVRKPSNANFHFERPPAGRAEGPADRSAHFKVDRPRSIAKGSKEEDGDTDSSFSWQGSTSRLNAGQSPLVRKWL